MEKYDGCLYSLCQKIQTLKILPKMQRVVMVSVSFLNIYIFLNYRPLYYIHFCISTYAEMNLCNQYTYMSFWCFCGHSGFY